MSPPQHRLAAGALSSATRAVELGTSCVATRRGQQGKLRGPESTPTALLARANWATCDEVNLGGFGRVRANVHAEERVPARINGNAAETFGRRQIGPPAHHYLAGMEYDAIEHAACTAHAGFVLVANEKKEFGSCTVIGEMLNCHREAELVGPTTVVVVNMQPRMRLRIQ